MPVIHNSSKTIAAGKNTLNLIFHEKMIHHESPQ